jgi:histidyl-tRNA synthetase
VKVNNRKLLDGVLQAAGVGVDQKGTVMRAIDKLDRLGQLGVAALLGKGRKDDSGDFTQGAQLPPNAIDHILNFVGDPTDPNSSAASSLGSNQVSLANFELYAGKSEIGQAGIGELRQLSEILERSGYGKDRIRLDPSIIRGLEYYTGAVFEAQLTFPVTNEAGEEVVFGSVAGGGRYDDLVARFTGQQVPATGISIGISRLLAALTARGLSAEAEPLVVVLAMDDPARSFEHARDLRKYGIRAEAYVGTRKFGEQLKYADKRGAAIAVIEGADELAKGEVTLKDLALGAELAKSIESRAEWVKERAAQICVPRAELVASVRQMLDRRSG